MVARYKAAEVAWECHARLRLVLTRGLMSALVLGVLAHTDSSAQMIEVRPGSTAVELQSAERRVEGASSLTGIVVDAHTEAVISSAVVNLSRTQSQGIIRTVVADSQGRFVFTAVPPGTDYTLSASGPGYADAVYAGDHGTNAPPPATNRDRPDG